MARLVESPNFANWLSSTKPRPQEAPVPLIPIEAAAPPTSDSWLLHKSGQRRAKSVLQIPIKFVKSSTSGSSESPRCAQQHAIAPTPPSPTQSHVLLSINDRPAKSNVTHMQGLLWDVAKVKAEEVEHQHKRFIEGKSALQHLLDCEPHGIKRLEAVLRAYKDLPMMQQSNNSSETFVANVGRFLSQASHDPCVRLVDWERRLMGLLDAQSTRYDYSSLYMEIMREWIKNSDEVDVLDDPDVCQSPIQHQTQNSAPSKEEYRKQWESYVFSAIETDQTAITAWLDKLLRSTESTSKAFAALRRDIAGFEEALAKDQEHFTEVTTNWCIHGLLASDLLTDDKRGELTLLQQDNGTLSQIADILNIKMNTLDRWAWSEEGVPAEQRRQLGSRYRIFHDEDLMNALLLRYIGVRWSVQISKSLTTFSEATWLSPASPIGKEERDMRERYLGYGKEHASGVHGQRLNLYLSDFFATQLLREESEVDRGYDYEEDQNKDKGVKIRKSAAELKHKLVQVLAAELALAKGVNREVTVLQSDFESFGPSIPHSTIVAVLNFFNVSQPWIQFFWKVLQVPIIFREDGINAEVRFRRRGTQMSSPLADVFGETILFCMDYSVWYHTKGLRLHRFHDDIWLWGPEVSVSQGWQAMSGFAKVMGLKFNDTKSGCVRVLEELPGPSPQALPRLLPHGDVRYGFLKLLPTGYFTIDYNLVDRHVDGLVSELASSRSLFAWLRIWNVYGVGFFTSMLGGQQPANCFGAQHITAMKAMFLHVYKRVFQEGNLTSHVRNQIKQRFPSFTGSVLDAFIFLPVELGGLGAQNPFVNLAQLHGQMPKDPRNIMITFLNVERMVYRDAKMSFQQGHTRVSVDNKYQATGDFLQFAEYIRRREEASPELLEAYNILLKQPKPGKVQISDEVRAMLGRGEDLKSYSPDKLYLLELYKDELVQNFGGLRIVEKKLLPTGMVRLARKQRIKWKE